MGSGLAYGGVLGIHFVSENTRLGTSAALVALEFDQIPDFEAQSLYLLVVDKSVGARYDERFFGSRSFDDQAGVIVSLHVRINASDPSDIDGAPVVLRRVSPFYCKPYRGGDHRRV